MLNAFGLNSVGISQKQQGALLKILCLAIALLLVSAAPTYAADAPVLKADFQEFGVLPYGMYFGRCALGCVHFTAKQGRKAVSVFFRLLPGPHL
jgi:hypothetical protein